MANYNTVTFVTKTARRIPDPNFKDKHGMERHLFVVPVPELPKGIPLDPNARTPKTRKRVYQKVRESLFNRDCEPGTFHLKNKGITIIADRVKPLGGEKYEVSMLNGTHGIVDGGHTYTLITEAQDDPDLPEDQYVNVEVRVGVPEMWIPEIAGGLNTSVQVEDMSLDNLAGHFHWIKEELKGEPYYKKIAWSENDPGEFDARDLVALMTLFNVALHSNDEEQDPVFAYERKSKALKEYEEHPKSFENMRGMLKDILQFHDIIREQYYELWKDKIGRNPGSLSFSEKPPGKRQKHWTFMFSGRQAEYRMVQGMLYPMLAAFRWHVDSDPLTGKMHWRGGFEAVKVAWNDCATPLLKATHEMSTQLNHKPLSVGKSRPHWRNLHTIVAKHDLQGRASGQ